MATPFIAQLTFQSEDFPKPVVAAFDMPDTNSEGGALFLKAIDSQFSLTV